LLSQKRENDIGRLVGRVRLMDTHHVEMADLLAAVRSARSDCIAAAFEEATPGAAGLATLLPVRDAQLSRVRASCGEPERIRQRKTELSAILRRAVDAASSGSLAL